MSKNISRVIERFRQLILHDASDETMLMRLTKFQNFYKYTYLNLIKYCIDLNRQRICGLICSKLHEYYLNRNIVHLIEYAKSKNNIPMANQFELSMDKRDEAEKFLCANMTQHFIGCFKEKKPAGRHMQMALYHRNVEAITFVIKRLGAYSAITATIVDPEIRPLAIDLINNATDNELKKICRYTGNTLLHDAVQIGNMNIIMKLLSRNIFTRNELNLLQESPIFRLRHDNPKLVELLTTRENCMSFNYLTNTPLHVLAGRKNMTNSCKKLITITTKLMSSSSPRSMGYKMAKTFNYMNQKPIDCAGIAHQFKTIRLLLRYESLQVGNENLCVFPRPLPSIIKSKKKIHRNDWPEVNSTISKILKNCKIRQLVNCQKFSRSGNFPDYIQTAFSRQIKHRKKASREVVIPANNTKRAVIKVHYLNN